MKKFIFIYIFYSFLVFTQLTQLPAVQDAAIRGWQLSPYSPDFKFLQQLSWNYRPKRKSPLLRGRTVSSVNVSDPVMASLLPEYMAPFHSSPSIVKVEKSKLSYVEVFLQCAPIIKYCLLNSVGNQLCSLSCLFDPFPVAKHTVRILDTVVKSLCSPIETIFDSGIPTLRNNDETGMEISNYQTLLTIKKQNYTQFSSFGPAALPMQLIKYGRSLMLDTIKPIVASLSKEINFGVTEFNDLNSFQNSACNKDIMGDSMQRLAEIFMTKPYAVDISLPGWFLISNIGQFDMSPLSIMIDTILNVYKLVIGVHCSLIQYAETGVSSNCEKVTGYTGFPNYIDGYKRQQEDAEEICGVLPDLPDLDMNKIFPNALPKNKIPSENFDAIIGNEELPGKGFHVNMNTLDIVDKI